MVSSRLLLLLCSVLSASLAKQPNVGSVCTDPYGQTGTCIKLGSCEPLMKLLKQQTSRLLLYKYLHKANCGHIGATSYVCCVQEAVLVKTEAPAVDLSNPLQTHPNRHLLPMDICGTGSKDLLVGGTTAELGEFPWLAMIGYRREKEIKFMCGGAAINQHYILTAAHCLHRNILEGYEPVVIRLGEHDTTVNPDYKLLPENRRMQADPYIEFNVKETIIYDEYNASNRNQHHDIGLIRVDGAIPVTRFVRPICLPTPEVDSYLLMAGVKLKVAGWGNTELGTRSQVKLKVDVPVMDHVKCAEEYGRRRRNITSTTQVCAGGEAGKDSCRGDSGGPLMGIASSAIHKSKRYFAIGIVSYGHRDCGTIGVPGIYTRVMPFVSWILDHMRP